MHRYVVAILAAVVLFAIPASAQAQYCWDTVCAAGTPAADCWRAWCPTYSSSYPAYTYSAPTYYQPSYAPSSSYTSLVRTIQDRSGDGLRQLIENDRRADETRQIVADELRYQRQFGWR